MSSVSNGLYFLTLPLVSVMRIIYRKIRHARYLYIKRNVEKVWGARYTLGARYLSKNTVCMYIYIYRLNSEMLDPKNIHSLLYAFFWVIPLRLSFICRLLGTLCPIFIGL